MRNGLIVVAFVLLLSSVSFADSKEQILSFPSGYAIPLTDQPGSLIAGDSSSLLPVRYSGQSLAPLVDQSPAASIAPQSSAVEAIPTPTAFHAGGLLLLVIFVGRYVRKLRWA